MTEQARGAQKVIKRAIRAELAVVIPLYIAVGLVWKCDNDRCKDPINYDGDSQCQSCWRSRPPHKAKP